MSETEFNQERDSYAELFAWESMIDDKARRLIAGDPTFCIDDEPADDRDEIQGRATDMTLSTMAQRRWCEEEGCCG